MRREILDLQNEMKKLGISMYLVPTADEHQSEYISEHHKFRAFLSGFTGSAGTLLLTLEECFLWTDGRYFVQAAKELENSGIILMKSGEKDVPTIQEYISLHIKKDEVLGFDYSFASITQGQAYQKCVEKNGAYLMDVSMEEYVWRERPPFTCKEIFELELFYTGMPVNEKLKMLRDYMKKNDVSSHIISTLDDVAWLFNLRGSDIPYNPVFYSYAVITMDSAELYVKNDALNHVLIKRLKEYGVSIREYRTFYNVLKQNIKNECILINEQKSSYKLYCILKNENKLLFDENPCTVFKAVKNAKECANLRLAHEIDGLVMCKFIYWIKENIKKSAAKNHLNSAADSLNTREQSFITECDAADYLDRLRLSVPECKDLSFDTIAAYGANAAMCHYSPNKDNPVEIKPEGFFLVDSGGQYLTGTTDVTRTIAVGPLSALQKRHYTLVLKGHIRLAMARFPKGVCGANLDILARGPLWQECLDYNHGTGHGVGYFLNVHEGPNNIHWNLHRKNRVFTALKPGMLTSNEPGLYLEGNYGIRLENLILTKPVMYTSCGNDENDKDIECFMHSYEDDRFLEFETVTKVPFEKEAIIKELLTMEELDWLNQYHKSIYELYQDRLTEVERIWLANATSPL